MPELIVYTQPNCRYSKELVEWLRKHGVPFVERDITKSREAWDELYNWGARATPLAVYDGKSVLGANPEDVVKMMPQNPKPKPKKEGD